MKFLRQIALIALLSFASSCAMIFNEKEVPLSINSNPSGADIFIDGQNFGKTPATIMIEPKNYTVTLNKEGYGSAQFQLESWATMRNGKCVADAMGTMLVIPLYSLVLSGKCDDFKQKEHFVNIPRIASSVGSTMGAPVGNSMLGIGNNPANMVDYYYGKDVMTNPYANPYTTQQQQNRQ